MVNKGDRVEVIKKGNLYEGERGIVALVGSPKMSYPVTVQFKDNSRAHFRHDELRKI